MQVGDKFLDAYHGDGPFDWAKIRAAGYTGVFLKASDGTSEWKPWVQRTSADAYSEGLWIGAYHWEQPRLQTSDQISAFLDAIDGIRLDGGIALDLEWTIKAGVDQWQTIPATVRAQKVLNMVTGLGSVGMPKRAYINEGWWQDGVYGVPNGDGPIGHDQRVELIQAFDGWDLWPPHYGISTAPPPFAPFGKVWAWQYTESGRVPGFPGDCDISLVVNP